MLTSTCPNCTGPVERGTTCGTLDLGGAPCGRYMSTVGFTIIELIEILRDPAQAGIVMLDSISGEDCQRLKAAGLTDDELGY